MDSPKFKVGDRVEIIPQLSELTAKMILANCIIKRRRKWRNGEEMSAKELIGALGNLLGRYAGVDGNDLLNRAIDLADTLEEVEEASLRG